MSSCQLIKNVRTYKKDIRQFSNICDQTKIMENKILLYNTIICLKNGSEIASNTNEIIVFRVIILELFLIIMHIPSLCYIYTI